MTREEKFFTTIFLFGSSQERNEPHPLRIEIGKKYFTPLQTYRSTECDLVSLSNITTRSTVITNPSQWQKLALSLGYDELKDPQAPIELDHYAFPLSLFPVLYPPAWKRMKTSRMTFHPVFLVQGKGQCIQNDGRT